MHGQSGSMQSLPKEKIYIHSDKNFYLAGELVWFKLYCLDANKNKPTGLSKVAYVEIVDRNNKPALRAKVPLTIDGANGSFYLPLTLNSGNYVLRAYTSLMKNYGSSTFFEKTISIANTMRSGAIDRSDDSLRAHIDFFPEGGQLVEDIETTVAYRITGSDRRGSSARSIIVDNTGDTITQFSPLRFGLGHFNFKPVKGKTYSAIVILPEGKFFIQALPIAESFGYVMNVTNEATQVNVKVQATHQPTQEGETLSLLIYNNRGATVSQQKKITYGSDLGFSINKAQLSPGLNFITLFDQNQQPVCERLIYNRTSIPVSATATTDKSVYRSRQAVDLAVAVNRNDSMDLANCSVSVYAEDSIHEINNVNISNWVQLFSELRGTVEFPDYYFTNDAGVDEATDNLLITQGWRRFKQTSENAAVNHFKFTPEFSAPIVSGKVINVTNGKLVAGADCSVSVPSVPFGFYLAQSDSLGNIQFEVPGYYGTGEIIAQVDAPNKNDYRIDFNSPFSDDACFTPLTQLSLRQKEEESILERSIAMQAQNIYESDSLRRFFAPDLQDTLPFFGRSEYTYMLDDYKRFTTMEEVLREYVTPINVALRGGKLYLSIFDESTKEIYHDNMLVLLDGVPLVDHNKIFSYDPLKVKRLDVVPRRFVYRSRYFHGIASFETYTGKFDGFELDPALVAIDYEGLQLQREFYSPKYDSNSSESRLPDFRTTLYWNPTLLINETGKASLRFFSSDQKGKFVVVIEGLTRKGNPVFATTSFSVE